MCAAAIVKRVEMRYCWQQNERALCSLQGMRYQGRSAMVIKFNYCGGPIVEGEKFRWTFVDAPQAAAEMRFDGKQWYCEYPILCERCAVKHFW